MGERNGQARLQARQAKSLSGSVKSLDRKIVDDVVAANRMLAFLGVLDAFGHVSMRDPRDPNRYIISRSLAPESVAASDILALDLDSRPVHADDEGKLLYRERFIHGEIYKVRKDVNAVVHSHSPTVVPFTVTKSKLRPLLHNAAFLGLGAPLFEIRKTGLRDSDLMILTPDLGKALAKTLGKNAAVVLMRGHGNSVVAPTPAERGVPRLLHRGQCPPAARGAHHRRPDHLHDKGRGAHEQRIDALGIGAPMGAVEEEGAARH